MNKTSLYSGVVALFALALTMSSGVASASDFTAVFSGSDLTTSDSVPVVIVKAGVDTDGDGAQEIVYARGRYGGAEQVDLLIYEYNGSDNGYTLVYSDVFDTPGTFSTYGHGELIIADWDNADGQEIIWVVSTAGVDSDQNLIVYGSTGDNVWGTGNTVANNEYHTSVTTPLVAYTGANSNDGGLEAEFVGADLGDPDGDSNLELIIADDDPDSYYIYELVSGTFVAGNVVLSTSEPNNISRSGQAPAAPLNNLPGEMNGSKYGVVIGDLNADGTDDILAASWNCVGIAVASATGADAYAVNLNNATPCGPAPADQPPKPGNLAIADIDGDGANVGYVMNSRSGDIYAIQGLTGGASLDTLTSNTGVATLDNVALGYANEAVNFQLSIASELQVTDIDADGNAEFVIAHGFGTALSSDVATEATIVEYSGSGDEKDGANYTVYNNDATNITLPSQIMSVAAGSTSAILDMDLDGIAEVVTGSTGQDAAGELVDGGVTVWELNNPLGVNTWERY